MSKVYICGDIHGNYLGLKQALERTPIKEGDTLISLGDLCDGHTQTFEVIELLIECSKKYNLILIKGNHDEVFKEWLDTGINGWNWQQGQLATGESYMNNANIIDGVTNIPGGYLLKLNPQDVPQSHYDLFNKQILFYHDDKNRFFVHGGFDRHSSVKSQLEYVFYWDRDLWKQALSHKGLTDREDYDGKFKIKDDFNEIFIGHTSTEFWHTDQPMNAANIWNLDTGGGWFGRITIMDVDTKEYWQSDRAEFLYPNFKGRK